MLGTHYGIYKHPGTKGRGELSIAIHGEDNEKRGRSRQGAATNAWEDHDTGSNSQSSSNLGNAGKGKEWLYRHVN